MKRRNFLAGIVGIAAAPALPAAAAPPRNVEWTGFAQDEYGRVIAIGRDPWRGAVIMTSDDGALTWKQSKSL